MSSTDKKSAIYRCDAIQAIMDLPDCPNGFSDTYDKARIVEVLGNVEEAVSVRKKGKWIVYKAPDKYHCGMVKCPFCFEEGIAESDEYHFCPKCGAELEAEKQNG